MEAYDVLAQVYDELAYDYDYPKWAAWYAKILRKNGIPDNAYILETACGTGNVTLELVKLGYEVVGMDQSAAMLREAAEKLRMAGVRVPLIRQDMQEISLPRKAAAVVCACDGVNYLTELSQMQKFFCSAYENLKPGGMLLFDVSTEYKLREVLGNELYCEEDDDVAYIWKNEYDEETRLLTMDLTIFIREGELYRKSCEIHRQRGHLDSEIRQALEQAGFSVVGTYSGFDSQAPEEDSLRVHYAAKKPE